MQNKKVSALLGSYCNYKNIKQILNNVKDEDKLKLVEIDINNSNNDELESLDTNLQKNGSCICTLFNYKPGEKDPSRKFNYQPLHTFTLEYKNGRYILHQSWYDGIINKECGFKYIVFSTNVSREPSGTKVFFLDVECAKCETEYRDIMGVRN